MGKVRSATSNTAPTNVFDLLNNNGKKGKKKGGDDSSVKWSKEDLQSGDQLVVGDAYRDVDGSWKERDPQSPIIMCLTPS